MKKNDYTNIIRCDECTEVISGDSNDILTICPLCGSKKLRPVSEYILITCKKKPEEVKIGDCILNIDEIFKVTHIINPEDKLPTKSTIWTFEYHNNCYYVNDNEDVEIILPCGGN